MKKIQLIIFNFFVLFIPKTWAQELKFPESFYSEPSLFKEMKIAEIPKDALIKYGIL